MAGPSPGKTKQAQADVWNQLFGTVTSLSEAVDLSIQALTPENASDKVMSATTRRRLHIKSLQGLRASKDNLEVLQEHLKALQTASDQWQKTMQYASKSHEDLMEQLESTNRDLQLTTERLRKVDALHLAAVRENDTQKQQMSAMDNAHKVLQASLKQREEELETSHFAQEELRARVQQLQDELEAARSCQAVAEQSRDQAVGALDTVRLDADKAIAAAQRHQDTVAKLTADNLVFVSNLKKVEAELAEALADRAQYKLAAEKQRGPWFDEVRASVEERVRHAMARAESLEADIEQLKKQHSSQLQDLQTQKSDLEDYVGQLRHKESSLEAEVARAKKAESDAESRAAAAHNAQAVAEHGVEELSMRNRVLQDQIKSMRQECTERWVTEQAALGKVEGLQSTIAMLEGQLAELRAHCEALESSLAAQAAVNRQLMARKEEVEWQLLEERAKVTMKPLSVTTTTVLPATVHTLPSAPPLPSRPPSAAGNSPAAAATADAPAPPPQPPAPSAAAAAAKALQPPQIESQQPVSSAASPARAKSQAVDDVMAPRRTASEFYGSPRAPELQPSVLVSASRQSPTPSSKQSARAPAAAATADRCPETHSASSSPAPVPVVEARLLQTAAPVPAPAHAPATAPPAVSEPTSAQQTATTAPPADFAGAPPTAAHQHRSSTPQYVASSEGIVPLPASAAPEHAPVMPPKAVRTSAVLLEQPQSDGRYLSADAFNIVKSSRGGAARQEPAHPAYMQPALAPHETAAAVLQPPQQPLGQVPAASEPQRVGQHSTTELEHAASLSLGLGPAPPVKTQALAAGSVAATAGSATGTVSSQSAGLGCDSRASSPLPTSSVFSATPASSPLARDPASPRAARAQLPSAPVYHPAMHPALLAPSSDPAAAARGHELSFGGAPTGRRISATSVLTTPPPKTRPA